MIKVTSKSEAWKVAKGYLGETAFDSEASKRAGYSIYQNDKGEWVSDLGSRLEITTRTETVNVWFYDVEAKSEAKPVMIYYKLKQDVISFVRFYGVTHYTVEVVDGETCVVVWYGDERASFPTEQLLSIQYDD